MTGPYTVALVGGADIPAPARIAAEIRFAGALERALGGAEPAAAAFAAWREASESDMSELGPETASLAAKWPRAFDSARQAGMREIGDEEAHFELSLSKGWESAPDEPEARAA